MWRLQTDEGDATALRPYPDPMVIVNMTVWSSVAALKEFAYRTVHAEFVARRREWFAAGSTGVVLWWIRAGDLPTVDDAKRRLEFLERHGPSPYAFRFARPPAPFVIERTSLEDPDTLDLIAGLNEELTGRYDDPSDNHFRLEPDEVSPGAGAVVVGRLDDRAVACGALRRIDDAMETSTAPEVGRRRSSACTSRPTARGQQARSGGPRPSRARGRRTRDRSTRARDR